MVAPAPIESFSCLSLEIIDIVHKTKMDDEECENLRHICFEPELSENILECNGQITPDNATKTALSVNEKGPLHTHKSIGPRFESLLAHLLRLLPSITIGGIFRFVPSKNVRARHVSKVDSIAATLISRARSK
jgi:hypothetical protein